jgi:outer membrane protein
MKRFIALATVVLFFGTAGYSQNLKFGHINSDELIQALPEYDSATAHLEKYRQELINYLELMSVELNNKSDAYNKEEKNLTDLVKQTKQQELVDLNRKIQEFQVQAQEKLQGKQTELFQPISSKVDKAIKDVGKEGGFVYIFDVSRGSLLYFDETRSTNIMPLAKTKLGIK